MVSIPACQHTGEPQNAICLAIDRGRPGFDSPSERPLFFFFPLEFSSFSLPFLPLLHLFFLPFFFSYKNRNITWTRCEYATSLTIGLCTVLPSEEEPSEGQILVLKVSIIISSFVTDIQAVGGKLVQETCTPIKVGVLSFNNAVGVPVRHVLCQWPPCRNCQL